MIGEVIYNDEDIKMLEEVLLILEDKYKNDTWKEQADKLREFIERMRFK